MKDDELFTRRQLAILLGRDRNTVSVALEGVQPDGVARTKTGAYPGYTLKTAERALRRRAGYNGPDIDFDLDLALGEVALRELLQ